MKRLIILLLILSSCTVTKSRLYTEKEVSQKLDSTAIANFSIRIDSFKETEKIYITKPIYNTVTIPLECDEDGNVKPINYNTSSGNNSVNATVKDGDLSLAIELDSVINFVKETYISQKQIDSLRVSKYAIDIYKKETSETKVKEKVRFLKHFFCYLGLLASIALNLYLLYKLFKSKIKLF